MSCRYGTRNLRSSGSSVGLGWSSFRRRRASETGTTSYPPHLHKCEFSSRRSRCTRLRTVGRVSTTSYFGGGRVWRTSSPGEGIGLRRVGTSELLCPTPTPNTTDQPFDPGLLRDRDGETGGYNSQRPRAHKTHTPPQTAQLHRLMSLFSPLSGA